MSEGRFKVLVEDRFGTVTDEYEFDVGEFILGRSSNCDIVLPGDNVSRQHARLFTKDNALFIEDMHSANGTYLNGEKISKPVILLDGSVFRIGDFHIHTNGGVQSIEQDAVFFRLIGLNRSVKDEVFEVKEKTALAGRGNDCQIVIIDPSISRVHARFLLLDAGTVLVKDMGSANGIYINNKRINTWELRNGDDLKIGDLEFKVEIPGANTTKTRRWVAPNLKTHSGISVSLFVIAGLLAVVLLLLLAYMYMGKRHSAYHPEKIAAHNLVLNAKKNAIKKKAVVPNVDISDILNQANHLLKEGDLDTAESLLSKADDLSPHTPRVIKLKNRVEVEKQNKVLLESAQKLIASNKEITAIGPLLQIPKASLFYKGAIVMLRSIEQDLKTQQKKLCHTRRNRRKIRCKKLQTMIAKIKQYTKNQ